MRVELTLFVNAYRKKEKSSRIILEDRKTSMEQRVINKLYTVHMFQTWNKTQDLEHVDCFSPICPRVGFKEIKVIMITITGVKLRN